MKTIVVFKTENEALRAKALLEEAEIPFVLRSYGDAVYSSVFQTQRGWGVLEAYEKDEATILELLKTQVPLIEQTDVGDEIEIKESKKSPMVWGNVVAVVFFILSCILGWMYWDTKKENNALLDFDLRNFEWSKNGEILVGRWKKNDKLAMMSYDTDFDLIFERDEYYDTAGYLNLINYDINANKHIDRYVSFTQKDSIRFAENDFNEDGATDDWQLFFTNGMSIRIMDMNLDRKFDSVEVINQKNEILKKYSMSDFLNKVKE